jgi:hypothetical protein
MRRFICTGTLANKVGTVKFLLGKEYDSGINTRGHLYAVSEQGTRYLFTDRVLFEYFKEKKFKFGR